MDWLYGLPDLMVASIFCVAVALAMLSLPRLVRRVVGLQPDQDATDFAVRAQATLITACIFVSGFSLVQAQSTYNRVENLVSGEANHINQLDRLLLRFGDTRVLELRGILLTYAKAVVADDWPQLALGLGSDRARQAFAPLSRGVLSIEATQGRQSSIYAEMLKKIDELGESRDARIDNANVQLPTVFWQVIGAMLAMVCCLACMIEQTIWRSVALAVQVAAVAGLLALVFITDRPFKGQSYVSPEPIAKVIKVMEARKP